MISREIRMIAQAVADGDETAALALFDALTEVRGRMGGEDASLWSRLLYQSHQRIKRAFRARSVDSIEKLTSMTFKDVFMMPGIGMTSAGWLQGWLSVHGLSLVMDRRLQRYEKARQGPEDDSEYINCFDYILSHEQGAKEAKQYSRTDHMSYCFSEH